MVASNNNTIGSYASSVNTCGSTVIATIITGGYMAVGSKILCPSPWSAPTCNWVTDPASGNPYSSCSISRWLKNKSLNTLYLGEPFKFIVGFNKWGKT